MLIVGSVLHDGGRSDLAFIHNFTIFLLTGTIGVISPSGKEVGPFLSIEQAALSRKGGTAMDDHV